MVWAGASWFACPEWGNAYLHPVKPLSDLIEKDPAMRALEETPKQMEAKKEPSTDQQVADRLLELKNEAKLLIKEK